MTARKMPPYLRVVRVLIHLLWDATRGIVYFIVAIYLGLLALLLYMLFLGTGANLADNILAFLPIEFRGNVFLQFAALAIGLLIIVVLFNIVGTISEAIYDRIKQKVYSWFLDLEDDTTRRILR